MDIWAIVLIVGGLVGMMCSAYLMFTEEEKKEIEMEGKTLIEKLKTRVKEDALDGKTVSMIILEPDERLTPEIKKQFADLDMVAQAWKANQDCSKFKKGDIFVTVTIPAQLSSVITMQMAEEIK